MNPLVKELMNADCRPGSKGYSQPITVTFVDLEKIPQLTKWESHILSDATLEDTEEFKKAAAKALMIRDLIRKEHMK